jgi:Rad3-related DNA helicase
MAHQIRRDVLIVDEAHSLLPYLKELAAVRIWKHVHRWPDSIRSYADVKSWLDSLPDSALDDSRGLRALRTTFHAAHPKFLIRKTKEAFGKGGEERPVLQLIPLDVSQDPSGSWLRSQKKLVLMSATLGDADLKDMGLLSKRVMRFSGRSPIPPDRRPVVYVPLLSLAANQVEESLPDIAAFVEQLLEHHAGEGGILHAPYSLARRLQAGPLGSHPRLLWHGREDKRGAIRDLREGGGQVLVASGLYEGLDLKGDDFTWQAILKVPWPYLGDPAIAWKAKSDEKWYAWQAARLILQACGRISRGPDDYGLTYIPDRSFGRLLKNNPEFFPDWWMEAYSEG